MSKAFPVAKDLFLQSADTEFQFRLKPPPAGKFLKTPKVKGTLNGEAVEFPQTSSKGWTEPGNTLYYLWLTLADGRTGWITSDPETPFVDGFDLTTVEGQTKRTDPPRSLMLGETAPETRRLSGFKASWAMKKSAEPVVESTETPAEGEQPKKSKKAKK